MKFSLVSLSLLLSWGETHAYFTAIVAPARDAVEATRKSAPLVISTTDAATAAGDRVSGEDGAPKVQCCDPAVGPGGCPDANGSFDSCWDEGYYCCSNGSWYAHTSDGTGDCQGKQLEDSLACGISALPTMNPTMHPRMQPTGSPTMYPTTTPTQPARMFSAGVNVTPGTSQVVINEGDSASDVGEPDIQIGRRGMRGRN